MSNEFNPSDMIERFRERAAAVKNRTIPPVEGAERKAFVERARLDYMDYAMLADGTAELNDGILTIKIDLRKQK